MSRQDPYLRSLKQVDYQAVDPRALQYAAGLSDADGCFNVQERKLITLQFTLTQSLKGIAALLYLYDNFGGSINLQLPGDDKNQRAYCWVVNGKDCYIYVAHIAKYLLLKKREAIRLLDFPTQNLHVIPIVARHMITDENLTFNTLKDCQSHFGVHFAFQKREQIHWQDWIIKKSLSSAEVKNIQLRRSQIARDLTIFKKEFHEEIDNTLEPDTPYLAGFFDGDGCIDTIGKSGQHHSISQKSAAICDLYKRLFGGCVSKIKIGYRWDTYDGADDFLRQIGPFIQGKRQQVEVVLAMKPGESEKIHASLRDLKGKGQMKTPRIDRSKSNYTAIKRLPKGVFQSHDPDFVFVQIQHEKIIFVLERFDTEDLEQAVALYKDTKRKIRLNKDFKITKFIAKHERKASIQ